MILMEICISGMTNRIYRMYGLVPYNISPIQQAIQYGHGVVEYLNKYFNTPECIQWRTNDKTFIILNGGTTNKNWIHIGTLNKHLTTLKLHNIPYASFFEPDLGDQLTAIVFLVDERVYDKKMWPDYNGLCYMDGTPDETEYYAWKMQFAETEEEVNQIIFLRDWLKQFRLA